MNIKDLLKDGTLTCPVCITGRVSYRVAMTNQNRLVNDWHSCSNKQCSNRSFSTSGEKGDRSGFDQIKHYFKINSMTRIELWQNLYI